jgi:hypothetical protein
MVASITANSFWRQIGYFQWLERDFKGGPETGREFRHIL